MNIKLDANRLADKLIDFYSDSEIANVSALMLKQQAKEIEELTITNQDLKYQLIKKSNEQVLHDFSKIMLQEQVKEIRELKEDLEDCICKGGHSQAYLKIKER